MSTRYFTSSPEAYEYVALQLNLAYGYPKPETLTERALPLLVDMPQANGLVYVAVDAAYCDYNLPSELLPQLLASGSVDEITESQYNAIVAKPV